MAITPLEAYRNAIASIESAGSGGYSAIGPTHPKLGRALGRYQVMEANIGPWSKEHLGREISAEEFMENPALQDAIFDGEFGSYVQKFGPEGAAQAWFGGEGGVGETDRKDVLGTTIGGYGDRFMNAVGGSGATGQQAQPAQPSPFGSMAPGNGPGGIPVEVAQYANADEEAGKNKLAGLLKGLSEAFEPPEPPRPSAFPGGPTEAQANGLLKYLSGPTVADLFIKKRMGA